MSEAKKIKPSLSKGTRDFLPAEVAKRNYIFDTIKSVFRKYGFEQIETPAIERLETLTGKYGEEGDKLLFKILNSGDYLKDVPVEELSKGNSIAITKYVAEKGLRYDLTVPLARYVVQHQDNLAFPFKRFHIGPVWRADRPQKGRYQEFYQCDADVIGSSSLLNEVELTRIYIEVFKQLGLNVTIRINHRQILQAVVEFVIKESLKSVEGKSDEEKKSVLTITVLPVALAIIMTAIDKTDKVGIDGAKAEMISKGIPESVVSKLDPILQLQGENYVQLKKARDFFKDFKAGLKGVEEIESLLNYFRKEDALIMYDSNLARGLNYYTGIIWEVVCNDVKIGSIASGGRYDNLTEMFGGQNMSGVGISFGIERIYDVMEELNLFPSTISEGVKVLFVPRDISVEEFTFRQVQKLRDAGIAAEIFLGNVKRQKHFDYVERKNIAYLVEVGDNEKTSELFRLRNAKTRETQSDLSLQEIIHKISEK